MITISEKEKYICIWGGFGTADPNTISKYKSEGYTIVTLSNGTGDIRNCLKAVAMSSDLL